MALNLNVLVGGFIGLVILLGVGTIILGNATMDCTGLTGYNVTTPASSTGWADSCLDNNTNAQAGFALLLVAVIIYAAVVILQIVKLL